MDILKTILKERKIQGISWDKLSDRVWVCENCKKEIDRDANAALNIRDYGIRFNPVNAKVVH